MKVVPLTPGGMTDRLERVGVGLGVVHRKEKDREDREAGLPKAPVEDEETAWKNRLGGLIELGKGLAVPTRQEKYWRAVPGRTELWKMPEGDVWVEQHLRIRTKLGEIKPLELNSAQQAYSRVCAETESKRNIVLKARQMGITSYIAARYFVQTITRPGTLTMLVAHDREAAEEIFRIVQPGRMKLAEDRLVFLEKNDLRRNVYDRIVIAAVTFAITFGMSALLAWRSLFGFK